MTSTGDVTMIVNAANFAAIKHKDQKRKDPEGTPYINHPLGVAHILSSVSIVLPFKISKNCRNFQRAFI